MAVCVLLGSSTATVRAEPGGHVTCDISENGQPATGVLSILKDGKEIATSACGRELAVPVGDYTAALRLDGAFDGPEQRQPVSVKSGGMANLKADFTTATLSVRIASSGRRAAGMAIIKRGGQQLGTLGSGVSAHLSTGTYHIYVRYRGQEQDLGEHKLDAGKQLALDAAFE
jgi:hypothetical protein